MLLPRFLTALIGVPLLLAAIWWGQLPFFILVFGVSILALYEYYALAEEANWPVSKKTGLILGGVFSLSIVMLGTRMAWFQGGRSEVFFLPAIITGIIIVLAVVPLFRSDKENAFIDIALTFFGIFYVVWTLSHLVLIRDLRPEGRLYTFFLFLVIWALDTGAYAGGKKFGRRALAESVSPKKTWEGVLFGTIAALLVALICQATFLKSFKLPQALILALGISLLAQLSDLSESLFKRNVGVKDSSHLLPGHGGFLDRFDSFLLACPAYYYALVLIFKS